MMRRLEQLGPDSKHIDLIHVFGGSAWDDAIELGREAGVPVAFEMWRHGLIDRSRQLRPDPAGPPMMFIAPDLVIEQAMGDGPTPLPVRVAPWGVYLPPEPVELMSPDRATSIFFTGPGRTASALISAFEGVVAALPPEREFYLFADAEGARRAGLWRVAEKLGVLDRFSLIDEMEGRRELVLKGDILVQPEARGEYRSLVLDAMASGMAVLAAEDPLVSYLLDGRTAKLVSHEHADAWSSAIKPLLNDVSVARDLSHRAREFVRTTHRVSAQVAAVLDAYESLTSPEPIPFDA
jgi:hypothetical protein